MRLKQILFGLLALALLMPSCAKYDDGPLLSLRSKNARMEGLYRIDHIENDTIQNTPNFILNAEIEIQKTGGGTLSFVLKDTIVNSNFQWEFNDKMTDFRIRRYYLHRDTVMYLSLDTLYYACFNMELPVYDNFQQAMYTNTDKWGEWGQFMEIQELSDDQLKYTFVNDSVPMTGEIILKE
jgi:hypothetical protein